MQRPPALTRLYDAARSAIAERADGRPEVAALSDRIFSALSVREGTVTELEPTHLPATNNLEQLLDDARMGPPVVRNLADAFRALLPELQWHHRAGAEALGEPFFSGHANTVIAGRGAYEERDDVIIGASVLSPAIDYPKHRHGPEEIYIVLSEGDWFNDDDGWHTPGVGGIVHHPPWLRHTMRSAGQPLLAVWCLHVGSAERH